MCVCECVSAAAAVAAGAALLTLRQQLQLHALGLSAHTVILSRSWPCHVGWELVAGRRSLLLLANTQELPLLPASVAADSLQLGRST